MVLYRCKVKRKEVNINEQTRLDRYLGNGINGFFFDCIVLVNSVFINRFKKVLTKNELCAIM